MARPIAAKTPDHYGSQESLNEDWRLSGGAWLSGFPEGPHLEAPVALVPEVRRWFGKLRKLSHEWSTTEAGLAKVDPMALLGERAALGGLSRRGRRSCGGNCDLILVRDGEIGVSHSRAFDREVLGAWLAGDPGLFADQIDPGVLAELLGSRTVEEIVDQSRGLGLPLSVRGEIADREPVKVLWHRPRSRRRGADVLRVLDLTALWAGPLALDLVGLTGVEVIKAENPNRPDGLRFGSIELFQLLNDGKTHIALDPTTQQGRQQLIALLPEIDVVVESSRPRALEQLGLFAQDMLLDHRHLSWVSITAYGRRGPEAHRVGFGDDVAIAAGLHGLDPESGSTCFLGDAIADPLTGLCAAGVIAEVLAGEEQCLVDVAMSRVAASCSRVIGDPIPTVITDPVPPRARDPLRSGSTPPHRAK